MNNDTTSSNVEEKIEEVSLSQLDETQSKEAEPKDLQREERPQAKSRLRSKKLMAIVSVGMVLLLLTGILVTMLLIDEISRPKGDPIATITLSNGEKLEFEVYESQAPIAATNFMFLSMRGYFNNTVFHDNQNSWLRFMGMTDYENYRGNDEDYVKNFKGFDIYDYTWAESQSTNPFYYRLRNDTNAINFNNINNNAGYLVFMYGYSSTLFQVSCVNNPSTLINNSKRESFSVFAKATDSTLAKLESLNLGSDYKEHSVKNGIWYNPNEVIRIRTVTIRNYDKKKWEGKKGILNNFDTYMQELSGYSQHATSYVSGI